MNSKKFFLISFLPALAYWYLEENYTLEIALTGGIILCTLELSLEKFFTKHIHSLSIMNFGLIVGLGSISLIAQDGIWFKLQPCFTGLIMGGLFYINTSRGKSFMYEIMESMDNNHMPKQFIILLEKHMGVFLFFYGIFMAVVALKLSTSKWLFFKTAGFYIVFIIFSIIDVIYIRNKIKKEMLFKEMTKF
jgi:intracellular septation protein